MAVAIKEDRGRVEERRGMRRVVRAVLLLRAFVVVFLVTAAPNYASG
jgi:hypothetical protein